MENERKINWLSLFIKVVIVFIFVLIIIWLVSKIINKNKLSETFINNINNMEKVSVEYFKTVDLPLNKGDSLKVTLGELIDKELIVSVGNDSKNTCDTEKSYSKITREKNKYNVSTYLKCGKEEKKIKESFSLKDCKNCNQEVDNGTENNVGNNDSTNSNSGSNTSPDNGNANTPSGVTYYEHVKETTSYTKWMRGSLTGNNIENRYEYYGVDSAAYYTLGVVPIDKKTITYTLKLNSVPNKKYYFTTIEGVNGFDISEKNNYLNEKNVSIYDGNKVNIPSNGMEEYSLTVNNFTYKLSPYYREGNFYIRVLVNINNTDNVKDYYDSKLKKNAYLIPLKVNVKFASNEISNNKPNGDYETISYYRYVTVNKETIWSKETYVDGYTKTGKTKVQ